MWQLFGGLFASAPSASSDSDAFEMHWKHVVSHYYSVAAGVVECTVPAETAVGDTNIAYHLDQMCKYMSRERQSSLIPSSAVSSGSGALIPSSPLPQESSSLAAFMLETHVLEAAAELAALDKPVGILVPITRLFMLAVMCHTRELVLDDASRLALLRMLALLTNTARGCYDHCKMGLDLLVLLIVHVGERDPYLLGQFLDCGKLEVPQRQTSSPLLNEYCKSSSDATLNAYNSTSSSLFSSSNASKESLLCPSPPPLLPTAQQQSADKIQFSLFDTLLDQLFQDDPLASLAQKGILHLLDVFESLDEYNLSTEADDSAMDDPESLLKMKLVIEPKKEGELMKERFSNYLHDSALLAETLFQELVLRFIKMMETDNPTHSESFYSLWTFINALSQKLRILLPKEYTRICECLARDFLKVSLFQLFVKSNDARRFENAVACLTELVNLSTRGGLLVPLLSNVLEARVESLAVAVHETRRNDQSVFGILTGFSKPSEAVLSLQLVLLEAAVQTSDAHSLTTLLKPSSATSSVQFVDRFLQLAYMGTPVPPSNVIQKDLDPYFFDALEKRTVEESGSVMTGAPMLRVDCVKGVGCMLSDVLDVVVSNMGAFAWEDQLRVSGVVGNLVWKSGQGKNGFEAVVDALEKAKQVVIQELGMVHIDVIVHQVLGGGRMDELSAALKLPLRQIEGVRILVEMAREVLAILLVRGVDLN
ncbi:hypothetical protein BJ741DRAFT_644820 [Chytriomyces cf. hyalinus JEL632]|nr:hypothetical protein BJ741DRAFT_644820 [Chytriomyces cf. hyalinus JEL632]